MNPTITDLIVYLKEKHYEMPLMDTDDGQEYDDWARKILELDRRQVFKIYYSGFPEVEMLGAKKPHWQFSLMQAEEDYRAGYIVHAVDYLVMQLKISPPHRSN